VRVTASGVEMEPPRLLFEGGFARDDIDPHIRYVDVGRDGRFRNSSGGCTTEGDRRTV